MKVDSPSRFTDDAGILPPDRTPANSIVTALAQIVMNTGEIVRLVDVHEFEKTCDLPLNSPHMIASYLGAPLVDLDGKILGTLSTFTIESRAWNDHDVDQLRDLAGTFIGELGGTGRRFGHSRDHSESSHTVTASLPATGTMLSHHQWVHELANPEFLSILSRELRIPLTPIVLATTSRLEEDDSSQLRPFLELITRNVEIETAMLNDLSDLSRIAQGQLTLNLDVVDLHACISLALESCGRAIQTAQVVLKRDLGAGHHHAQVDHSRIKQVICKLLKNVVELTPVGGGVSVRTSNPREGWICIEVTDTGTSIDPQSLPQIFEPLQRAVVARKCRTRGLGLDLIISKELVRAQGGTLVADRSGPQGARFRLELETVAPILPMPTVTILPKQSIESTVPPLKILLVEDDRDTLRYLSEILRRRGHEIIGASTIAEALNHAKGARFDLMLSDIELSDGSGLELMRELSEQGMRGIAMSGFGSEDDILLSQAAGFSEHLTKPLEVRRLEASIARVIAAPRQQGSPD